jgi:multidrug efflux pump
MMIQLKPVSQRDPTRDVIARLRPKLARITGVSAFLTPVQDLRVGGRGGNASYQYTLKADDPDVLKAAANKLTAALKKEPMLADVDVDQNDSGANVYVAVDRDAASRLGIDQKTIDNILYDGFGQRQVGNIYAGLNQYHIVMGVAPQYAGAPEALAGVYLPTGGRPQAAAPPGTNSVNANARDVSTAPAVNTAPAVMTPLSAIARWQTGSTAAQVNHSDGAPSATISFSTAGTATLGQASDRIRQVQAEIGLPASVRGEFAGTAKAFAQSTSTMPILILSALAVIYIVLGVLYESWIHPLTVLSTLPSAGLGAVAALKVMGGELDLIALIGLILLIGIVKKNAIMIIDFALEAERGRGLSSIEAIREASMLRFRPILMTTLAAMLGAAPLVIASGPGAALRQPLGITIIGGLIASQFLTLLTTPVVYLALDRFRRRGAYERHLARVDPGAPGALPA